MHLVVTGGGTGGHIFPALEIIKELKAQDKNLKITYVGNINGPEKKLAEQNNVDFFGLNTHKLVGQSFFKKLKALFYLMMAAISAGVFLIKRRPQAIIGVGGYVCAPMLVAGFVLGIKRYICEQNVVPGLANKIFAKIAHKIFISFSQSADFFDPHKIILSGNPVRKAFFACEPKKYNKTKNLKILVSGGSMGATFLNTHIPQAMALLRQDCPELSITHQTGGGAHKSAEVKKNYDQAHINSHVLAFIENMPEFFNTHDLLISRAGATVSAEIMASGMPAILVPYRFANGHQKNNALALLGSKASLILEESDNFSYELAQVIRNFYRNKAELESLSAHAKALANPHAATLIATTVLKECQ